jgi:hypothetical protein
MKPVKSHIFLPIYGNWHEIDQARNQYHDKSHDWPQNRSIKEHDVERGTPVMSNSGLSYTQKPMATQEIRRYQMVIA